MSLARCRGRERHSGSLVVKTCAVVKQTLVNVRINHSRKRLLHRESRFYSNNSKARLFTLLTLQRYFKPKSGYRRSRGEYPLLMRYSVTVLQFRIDLFRFLLMGSGSWSLGWEFCFSGIEDFLYQQD